MEGLEEEAARAGSRGRVRRFASWWARAPWRNSTPHFLDMSAGNEPETFERPGCREPIHDVIPGCRGCLVKLLVAFLLLQVVFQWQRRCPPIRGEVVELGTSRPVVGALVHREMMGYSRNVLMYLGGGSPSPLLPWKPQTTNPSGAFRFPTAWTAMAADPLMVFYGPPFRTGISVLVYSPDHIPVALSLQGFDAMTYEGQSRCGFAFRLERKGTFWFGYRYRIEMERAETQEQWEAKCQATLLLSGEYAPSEITDEWVFQDLSRYLQQWPQGEKAREFYTRLWNTTSFAYWPCEDMRAEFASGRLSGSELTLYWERGSKILSLARDFSSPPGGMDRSAFERGLANHEASLLCAKDLLDSKDRD